MSDEGEKTCPLCAEEMDLTDQQLKPCKCGYEICVWCWHHIMDMAEKDDTEGRCPACRTPYNKEKIVGTTANCERLVAEMSTERKLKSQKTKSKTSEGRKQLTSVRVIQRNLVYIVGLPLNLADEEVLQHKEYFGQYGKVLKVSISRTAAGAIQHFANNTCSVYITYSKEEDAVRCIQSVHGFVLEGRSLRACFGTTKYCHAWLRNVPCSNPDCLYLHEIGSQEDSFTKDEVISAYTRSRVQQITGATNNMQRRSGNVLPPPADEYCSNSSASSGKPISKSASNNPPSSVRGSPPKSSSGSAVALPAAASWGMRASNSQPPLASLACSNGPSKQKTDAFSGSMAFSTAVASTTQVSTVHGDVGKKIIPNEESRTIPHKGRPEPVASVKQCSDTDFQAPASETCVTPEPSATSNMNSQLCCPPSSKDKNVSMTPNFTHSVLQGCDPGPQKDLNVSADRRIRNLCSDMSSMSMDRHPGDEHSGDIRLKASLSDNALSISPGNWGLQQYDADQFREPSTSLIAGNAVTSTNEIFVAGEMRDRRLELETQVLQSVYCEKEVVPSIDDERLKDPEVVSLASYFSNPSQNFHSSSRVYSPQNEAYSPINFNVDPRIAVNSADKVPLPYVSGVPVVSNGYLENLACGSADLGRTSESYLLPSEIKRKHMERFEGETANITCNTAPDIGESSIISNILSMDCDAWDESLTSPHNLARLLGETDKPQGSVKVSSSWKGQNSNQSRFSFARQEESKDPDVEPSFSNYNAQVPQNRSFGFVENKDSCFDTFGNCNGYSSFNVEESDNFAGSLSHLSSNKLSVSRAQISAPPGFSVPSRAPPPGFSSHERVEQAFDNLSGNRLLDNSSLLRNPYQAPPTGNVAGTGDIEFMDPAILAVGKGRIPGGLNNPGLDMRSNFSPQLSSFENEARLQLLAQTQRPLSMHQNLRFSDMGDNFSSLNDAYGIPSRIMEQSPSSNLSPFSQLSLQQSRNALMSNGHRDGWNEVQSGNDLGMADILRTERLGFNKFYANYEDSKFRMPSSGNLYNRTFGI